MVSTRDKEDESEAALVEDMKLIPLSEMDSTIDEDKVRNLSELFSHKNVSECVQPELMVCYQENSYVIKDICVDEGIPKEKISLVGIGSDENDECESRIEKKIDIQILISEQDNDEDSCENVLGKLKPIEDFPQSFNLNGNADDELEHNQVPTTNNVSPLEDQLKSGFVSMSSMMEVEKSTFIIPDPHLKPPPTDDGNDKRDLDISNGESSFGPVSGLITYSGPISYAGSISIRSDSSTTSARSFAFPVLQAEWNSSPVRMARADGRHYRRHRRWWRHSLLCCRF